MIDRRHTGSSGNERNMRSPVMIVVLIALMAAVVSTGQPTSRPVLAQTDPGQTHGPTTGVAASTSPTPATNPSPDPDPTNNARSVISWPIGAPQDWDQPPTATARSTMVVDAETGQVLVAHNPDERMPVASTIKLVTALTALSMLDVDDKVTVGPEVEIGGSSAGLDPGDTWTVYDLVVGMLLRSGNDAAEALAVAAGDGDRAAFIAAMGELVRQLGIEGATITDPSGLEDTNLLSARDLATIARAALDNPVIAEIAAMTSASLPSTGPVPNRNLLLERYDGATGLKTGTTDLSGASLVGSAVVDGREVVSVVLATINDEARYDETVALLDWVGAELDPHGLAVGGRVRLPGRWVGEAVTVNVWAPEVPALDTSVAVDGSSIVTEVGEGGIGRLAEYVATTELAPHQTAGSSLTGAIYDAMRQAHQLGLWPPDLDD